MVYGPVRFDIHLSFSNLNIFYFSGYKAAIDSLRDESISKYSNRIKFKTPEMVNDWKKVARERNTPEFFAFFGIKDPTIYDTYLKSGPASNKEANLDRYVTSLRHVVESVNKSIKRFKFFRNNIQDCIISFE